MQMKQAEQLRKRWADAGNKDCKHPKTEREHALGMGTGDRVCTTCGAYVG